MAAQPLELLTGAEFNPSTFVADALESFSLEELRRELADKLQGIRTSLVEAINHDYTQFVTLSSQLDGLDGALLQLRAPVAWAASKLGACAEAVSARVTTMTAARSAAERAHLLEISSEALCDGGEAVVCARGLLAAATDADSAAPADALLLMAQRLHRAASMLCAARRQLAGAKAAIGALANASSASVPPSPQQQLLPLTGAAESAAEALKGDLEAATAAAAASALAALGRLLTAMLEAVPVDHGAAGEASDAGLVALACAAATATTAPLSSGLWHRDALSLLLAALSLLRRSQDGEAAVVARVSRPLLGSLLNPSAVDDGARGSFRGLPKACDALVTALIGGGSGGTGAVLWACIVAAGGLPGYDPLVSFVWAPFVSTLSASLPAWATPTSLTTFPLAYSAVSGLFQRVLSIAATLPPVVSADSADDGTDPVPAVPATDALLRCAASAELRASISPKLEVFQALRSAEFTSRLDKACSSGAPLSVSALAQALEAGIEGGTIVCLWARELLRDLPVEVRHSSQQGTPSRFILALPATAAAWAALEGVWASSSFLPSLHKQCLSLTLVLAMRYGSWSAAGAARGAVTCGSASVLASLQGQAAVVGEGGFEAPLPACTVTAWADAARKAPAHSSGGSGAGSSAAQVDLAAWAEGAGTTALHVAAAHDAASLAALLRGVLVPRILSALGVQTSKEAHAATAVRTCLGAAASHLDTLVQLHFAVARAGLSATCVAGIGAMRAVPATFRLATSQATRASPYVAAVSRPLRQLLSGHLRPQAPDAKVRPGESIWNSILPPPSQIDIPSVGVPGDALSHALRALALSPAPAVLLASDPAVAVTATVPSSLSTLLVYGVAFDITTAVASTLGSVLDSVSQVEESLGWLRKAQEKGAPATGAPSVTSEAERVVAQLSLDVLAIASELRDAGATRVEEFGSFQLCLQQLADFRKRGAASTA